MIKKIVALVIIYASAFMTMQFVYASDWSHQKFGVFIHYGWGKTPDYDYGFPITQYPDGSYPQSVDETADNFNVEQFANDMAQIGPEYVIFTAWHGGMYPLFPSQKMDEWLGAGHRSERDLIGEVLDALIAKDIQVVLYTQPEEAHNFSPEEQAAVGFEGKATYSLTFNDFVNDVHAEMIDRYGTKISGFWFDSGSRRGSIDKARLRETVLSRLPDAILISINEANEVTDFGSAEIRRPYMFGTKEGFENIDASDVETWPGLDKSVAFVNDQYWWSVPGTYTLPAEQMYKYNVMQAATNHEGGGVSWAIGPFPGEEMWNANVMSSMTDLGNRIAAVGESIKNTVPSTSWPSYHGARINELAWGAATQSADGNYEYLHILHTPSGNTLTISAPEDSKNFASAINVRTGNTVVLNQTASEINLTLDSADSWHSVDTVIRLSVDGIIEPPPPSGDNIAEGKTATQSTTDFGGEASRAVDGNTNGKWSGGSVTHTLAGAGNWWQVNLDGIFNIGTINVWNRTDANPMTRLSDYTVQVINANGAVAWENHQTEFPNPATELNAGGVIGSIVRVMQNSEEPLSLAEVEVFGVASSTTTTLNNTDINATYTGSWKTSSNRGAGDYDDDVQASRSANAAFEYIFTGTGIEYIAPMSSGYAGVEVFIDGVYQGTYTADNGSTYSPQEVIFSVSGLAQGQHTINVVKTSGSWLQLDALVITN